jgi:protein involved in polysaccharide export with SLBB domain
MNPKSVLASTILLACMLIRSPAQQLPAATPLPVPDQIMVNVLGEVGKPARIALPKGGTLLDAIASAGGFGRFANLAKIILIHKSTGEKPEAVTINIKPILSGTVKDIPLRDGDTVNVVAQTVNF